MDFFYSCPCLKFAHFTANQAILEAVAASTRVHVVDFGFDQGMQWPALIQALALRPGGPPAIRITGIGPPRPDHTGSLQQAGRRLAQLADTIGVEFEFRGFVVDSVVDLEPAMLDIRPEIEFMAVNLVFELNRILDRPGSVDKVLASIRAMNPQIVVVVEEEVNRVGPAGSDRFVEACHHCSDPVDSPSSQNGLARWRTRFEIAGFDPVQLGPNAVRQAKILLDLFGGDGGYTAEESSACLFLCWCARPIIAVSAWKVAGDSQ